MERLARVTHLWNWLPGFRAVAETENVHDAARSLGVSPSSLCRTIGLLEKRLERPLFERTGRAMHLTPLGRDLLGAVRDAMRAVDDVTAAHREVLRVAAPSDLAAMFVIPVVAGVQGVGLSLARISADPQVDPVGRLLRGELDLVLGCTSLSDRRLVSEEVGDVQVGLYVSATRGPRDTTAPLDDILARPFVVYRAPGGVEDHWPAGLVRTVALEVHDPRDAALAAAQGDLVVALPDLLVQALALPLWRLEVEVLPRVPLYAARRRTLGRAHAADALVTAIRGIAQGPDRATA